MIKKLVFLLTLSLVLIPGFLPALASEADPVTKADKAYFRSVQNAIAHDHKEWVAIQVNFPVHYTFHGVKKQAETQKKFLQHYNEIVNDYVRESVLHQNADGLFKNSSGIMVGDGALWIAEIGGEKEPSKYIILTINNVSPNEHGHFK